MPRKPLSTQNLELREQINKLDREKREVEQKLYEAEERAKLPDEERFKLYLRVLLRALGKDQPVGDESDRTCGICTWGTLRCERHGLWIKNGGPTVEEYQEALMKWLGEIAEKVHEALEDDGENLDIVQGVQQVIDACAQAKEDAQQNADRDEIAEKLDECVGDRKALLERAGLTDFQWSCQGGRCASDFDY